MQNKKNFSTKAVAVVLAAGLLVGGTVGGTVAWLTAKTEEVTNTFTVGKIQIALTETDAEDGAKTYSFVPGDTLAKDPKVTVTKDSEDHYLFVKAVVENNECTAGGNTVNPIIDWEIASGWKYCGTVDGLSENATSVESYKDGIYYFYRVVSESKNDQSFYVLEGKHTCDDSTSCNCETINGVVTVSPDVTEAMIGTINTSGKNPTLKFSAAAVQSVNLAEGTDAFAKVVAELPGEFYTKASN